MIEVDAETWHWTGAGMRRVEFASGATEYIEKREVERLLEEAYRRGRHDAKKGEWT